MNTTTNFIHPTTASFDEDVLRSNDVVLVDFWAPWCGPCVAFKPTVEAVASETGLKTAFVNVDEQPGIAERYGIRSIPSLKLFRAGELVAEQTGALPKAALEAWLKQHGA